MAKKPPRPPKPIPTPPPVVVSTYITTDIGERLLTDTGDLIVKG